MRAGSRISSLDRFLQQAVMQQRRWDPTFSDRSYGFRPRRSAHQAVTQASDEEHHAIHHAEAQAQSERVQECGGQTAAAEGHGGTGPVYAGLAQLLWASAKLLAFSGRSPAGFAHAFVRRSGDNGKPPGVVEQLSWQWVYVQRWLRIPPVAAAVPGTSPTPRPYPSRFPRPISNRSVSRIWRMGTSVTISNRRVRTRTHGGVAGVGG